MAKDAGTRGKDIDACRERDAFPLSPPREVCILDVGNAAAPRHCMDSPRDSSAYYTPRTATSVGSVALSWKNILCASGESGCGVGNRSRRMREDRNTERMPRGMVITGYCLP